MNTIDFLLNNDASISNITNYVKIKRLSDLAESDVIFKIRALSFDEYIKVMQNDENSSVKLKVCTIGIVEPDLNNKNLQMRYNAKDAEELADKILLMGEVSMLYDEICDISGFNNITSKILDIKN